MSHRASRWLDAFWTPRRIRWTGWLLFVIYCYPGYMSTDSVDQLMQARGVVEVHDWYPPLMVMLWRLTDSLIAGPFPMLIIQSIAFLLGLEAILARVLSPRRAALAASLILLFPPVITTMAVIWKDSQMAGFLLAGTACLLSAKPRWRLFGCVLLCLATAQRYNAPAATLPIVLALFTWRTPLPRLKRYLLASGVWLAITVTAFGANRVLTERKTYAWHGSVALLDIVGTAYYAPAMTDGEVRERLAGVPIVPTVDLHDRLKRAYSPRGWFGLIEGERRVLDAPQNETEREAVSAGWSSMVSAYPAAYVRHRVQVFRHVLGLAPNFPTAEWDGFTEIPVQQAILGHAATHSVVQRAWLDVIPEIQDMLMFRAWAYLIVGLALLALSRRNRLAFAIVASGVLYEFSLVVAAPSSDYRYSHWMMVAVLAGLVLVFVTRMRARSRAPA